MHKFLFFILSVGLALSSCKSPCTNSCQHENSGCANGSSDCDCECYCNNAYEGKYCDALKSAKLVGNYAGTETRNTGTSSSNATVNVSIAQNTDNPKEFFIIGHTYAHGDKIRCAVDIYNGNKFEMSTNTYTSSGVQIAYLNGDNLTYNANTKTFTYTFYYQGLYSNSLPLTIRGSVVKQ